MKKAKEAGLRKIIKGVTRQFPSLCHLSWIESHATALGAPDVEYCVCGVEGWIELKAGPDLDVRASQVTWMEEHVKSGGHPLFLIQWLDLFAIVPGSRAASLRADPELENILRLSSTWWKTEIPINELFKVMRNPYAEYRKDHEDIE